MGKIIQLSKKILNLYWLNHSDLVWAIFDSERNVGSRFWKKDRKWTKTEAFNQTSPLTNSFNFSRKILVQKHTLILYLHTGVRCYRKSIQWSYKQGLHAKITARQCICCCFLLFQTVSNFQTFKLVTQRKSTKIKEAIWRLYARVWTRPELNQFPKLYDNLDSRSLTFHNNLMVFWITGLMFSKMVPSQMWNESIGMLMRWWIYRETCSGRKFWKLFLIAKWFWANEMKIVGYKVG